MPALYIITGSNGAGKSSVGPNYIPKHLREVIFDGDKLFISKRDGFWRGGIRSAKECSRLAMAEVTKTFEGLVDASLQKMSDFAYEGHFTNDATWNIPKKFRDAGYHIHLIFFGLTDITLSGIRVIARSKEGGHYVDPMTIQSNFYGNLQKLDVHFSIFDSVTIVDTSGTEHIGLVILIKGRPIESLPYADLPYWFTANLPTISAMIAEM